MEKHSDRTTCKRIVLLGKFPMRTGEGFLSKGKNLRDVPRLNQEARGYFPSVVLDPDTRGPNTVLGI